LRAVELRTFGGPEGLVATELPDPAPGPGEVVVDILACSDGPTDALAAQKIANANEIASGVASQ